MRFLIYLLFVICCLGFSHLPVTANESALSLSPAIYESVVQKGGYVKSEIYLTNLTNFPLPIKALATKFLANEQIDQDSTNTFDASSWFTLDPADFILQPSERKKITLTVTAPRTAEPGGHYATIFFQPLIPTEVLNNPSALARVGVLAFIIIPGDLTEKIEKPALTHPTFLQFGPLELDLKLTNAGNVHTIIQGEIKVTDLLHREITSLKLTPNTVLPGTEKSLSIAWDKRIGLGIYFFEPNLRYGADGKKITLPTTTVWFLPLILIIPGVLLLTFVYKIFILNSDRVKLAWRALHGNLQEKDINHDQVQTQQKNLQKTSRLRHRRSSPHRSH